MSRPVALRHLGSRGGKGGGELAMKGVVFTEFLEMVEDRFSPDMADRIIEEANLPSGGAYTSIATYDHEEMLRLVSCLSRETGIDVAELYRAFGSYLFKRFYVMFPGYFSGARSAFDFLQRVEDYIHIEVRKLYPDAELPTFVHESPRPDRLVVTYRSNRPFAALADGLIRGCVEHYGEPVAVEMEDLSGGAGTMARFVLTRQNPPR
jgi:hypothetical protein